MLAPELTVTGRRIRIPVPLLLSPHHTPQDVAVYAVLDLLSGRRRGPAAASRRWIAARLGVSESGVAKSLARLTRPHTSDLATVPDAPAFVSTRVRGCQLTALRQPLPAIPYVDVPEWTLGDDTTGPLVSAPAWRLYAGLVWLRCPQRGTVAWSRQELASLLRVRPDRIPKLIRELVAAGMVTVRHRPGKRTLIMPILARVTQTQADRLWEAVLTPAEQALTAAERRADATEAAAEAATAEACGQPAAPRPSAGTSPPPSAGTSPHPSPGTSIKDPHYGDPHYQDPARTGVAAPCRAATPGEPDAAGPPPGELAVLAAEATGRTAYRLARQALDARLAARRAEQRARDDARARSALERLAALTAA